MMRSKLRWNFSKAPQRTRQSGKRGRNKDALINPAYRSNYQLKINSSDFEVCLQVLGTTTAYVKREVQSLLWLESNNKSDW